MPDTILLPIDLQHPESWEKALPAAREMAGATGTIHLLGIVLDIGSSMVATYLPKGFEVQMLEAMKDALNTFADQQMPGEKVQTHVGHGHVAETILRSADKLGADLIVMASHKPDELRSVLISSHANAVVRHAPMSVLVVR